MVPKNQSFKTVLKFKLKKKSPNIFFFFFFNNNKILILPNLSMYS